MSTTSVSKRLQLRVLDVLRTAGQPLTTAEVAMLVGKSFEATRHALTVIGAQRADVFPTEWTIAGADLPSTAKRVPSKFTEDEYTVSTALTDDIVVAWNSQRAKLGAALADTPIEPGVDPKKLAVQLGSVAGSIAALAYALNSVAGKPDWLDILTPTGE